MTIKVSIITVVYNRVDTILDTIVSVQNQSYKNIEHIIVDGFSTDGSVEVIKSNLNNNTIFISERDNGIYNAINKGIQLCSGGIIGILNSDDFFAYDGILLEVEKKFEDENILCVYADLDYIDKNCKIVRKWRTDTFAPDKLIYGWMPPHPAIFFRSTVYSDYGLYDEDFKISSDYDFMLRFFSKIHPSQIDYIPKVAIKMRKGGISNSSISNIFLKMIEDYCIIKKNKTGGFKTLIYKNFKKLNQFFK